LVNRGHVRWLNTVLKYLFLPHFFVLTLIPMIWFSPALGFYFDLLGFVVSFLGFFLILSLLEISRFVFLPARTLEVLSAGPGCTDRDFSGIPEESFITQP